VTKIIPNKKKNPKVKHKGKQYEDWKSSSLLSSL
jgi:hypothetical protein